MTNLTSAERFIIRCFWQRGGVFQRVSLEKALGLLLRSYQRLYLFTEDGIAGTLPLEQRSALRGITLTRRLQNLLDLLPTFRGHRKQGWDEGGRIRMKREA
jgi:hypothetical protein